VSGLRSLHRVHDERYQGVNGAAMAFVDGYFALRTLAIDQPPSLFSVYVLVTISRRALHASLSFLESGWQAPQARPVLKGHSCNAAY
jgi:hypothetical protein